MNNIDIKSIITQTLNENTTHWGTASGVVGYFTISEWCVLITVIITIITFIKNLIVDVVKIKLMRDIAKNGGTINEKDRNNL